MSLRNQQRDFKLNMKALYVLEAELFEISQQTKLNKDARNRKKRLEKVIAVKRLALQAVQDKIAREVDKQND